MRVLVDVSAVPVEPVGAGVYTVELVSGLGACDGLDLHLCARADDRERWATAAPAAALHATAPSGRAARLAWEQLRAPRLASELGLDVWHGPHYTLPLRARVPRVVTCHDLTFFDHPEWHERSKVAYFRRMIPAAVRCADAIVAVSEHTAQGLRSRLAPEAPIVVAPHGVDHRRFRPGPVDGDRDQLAALGIRPPYIAFAGRLEPRKDVPTLVRAFARAARARPDLRLVLAGGDGWGARAVRDAITSSGVASRILRTGYVATDTVPALFRNAEIVAYPSLVEGFGLPALEALACGAPLVTTSGSAVEEVVADAAILIRPGDADGLADALEQLLTDRSTAARLRARGPERAACYTWEASIARHLDAYRVAASVGAEART